MIPYPEDVPHDTMCVQSYEDIDNRLIQRTNYCKDKCQPYHQQVCVNLRKGSNRMSGKSL